MGDGCPFILATHIREAQQNYFTGGRIHQGILPREPRPSVHRLSDPKLIQIVLS